MSLIHIDASPKQLSRLRNGHNVRIKRMINGEGFNLFVQDPTKYRHITQTFAKDKGVNIQLSPEEIEQNKNLTPEYHQEVKAQNPDMSGSGIFGKKFDRFVRRTIGKKAKRQLYNATKVLKPYLKRGLDELEKIAPELGASALSSLALMSGNPELIPLASKAGEQLGSRLGHMGAKEGKRFLDGGNKHPRHNPKDLQMLNKELGTNYDYLRNSALGVAEANQQSADMMPNTNYDSEMVLGSGLYAGGNLRNRKSRYDIGMNGGMLYKRHPALISQPAGAHFQHTKTLPPQFQKFHIGIGSGLYL